ncbi:major capsid protein P2 [Catenovulum agarivorans]|uniref:major capsid protein P2 n=1 Tax=Catenovulum agarivorans TaxID=1172192 RepID=UPI0002EBE2AC|nr:major capsid protein P2 [Catenovulum agarivorans]
MQYSKLKLTGFTAVNYGGQANISLNTGAVIKYMVIEGVNIDRAQMLNVKLELNGRSIVDVKGDDLVMIDTYKSFNQDATRWVIPFADMRAKTELGEERSGLVTVASDNLNLFLKLGAKTQAQIDNNLTPELKGYVVQRGRLQLADGTLEPRVYLPRIYAEYIPAGATGEIHYKTFPKGREIRRMHMRSANVTELTIKRDGYTAFELTKAENNFELTRGGDKGLTPQNDVYHFDPISTGWAAKDVFKTNVNLLEIIPTVSSAGDIYTVFETIETANGA